HPLQDGDAAAAMALVERGLRLHHRYQGCDRLDCGQGEPLEAGGSVLEPPGVEQGGVRVDAGAELAALPQRIVEAGAERRLGHGASSSSATRRVAVVGSWSSAMPT